MNSAALTWIPLVLVLVVFFGALPIYAVRSMRHGLVKTERGLKMGGSVVLSLFFLEYGLWLFRPLVTFAVRLGISPDQLSWASLWFNLAAAVALSQGGFGFAGWTLLGGAICDSLDGSVARARGMSSDAGEVLDAVIDRWAEMATYFGMAWYYRNDAFGFVAALSACAGAVMVSYTRAKGESVQVDASLGLMQRQERATYLIIACVFSTIIERYRPSGTPPRHWLVLAVLVMIAVLANWTGIRRSQYIRRVLRSR